MHVGHALDLTLQDILTRWQRMLGKNALWVPGTDHAGIGTQIVVERELAKEGKTRQEIGREAFEKRAWEWKEYSHERIIQQIRKLGLSCDWSRERFTLDEGLSKAVRTAFVRLYKEGLITKISTSLIGVRDAGLQFLILKFDTIPKKVRYITSNIQ